MLGCLKPASSKQQEEAATFWIVSSVDLQMYPCRSRQVADVAYSVAVFDEANFERI